MVALEVGKIFVHTYYRPEDRLQFIRFRMTGFLAWSFLLFFLFFYFLFFSFLSFYWHLNIDLPSKHTPSIPHTSLAQDSFPRQSPAR